MPSRAKLDRLLDSENPNVTLGISLVPPRRSATRSGWKGSRLEARPPQKEARECKFFLRMLVKACPELRVAAILLWREANELHLIFSRIRRTAQENLKAIEK